MKTIRSIMARHRLPSRIKYASTRIGSLILLFQRMPVVQFLFPEANVIGGAAMANSVSLAITTVVGLGAFDSVAGQTTIDEVTPLAVTGASSNAPSEANSINVPATVSDGLNFEFKCDNAESEPKSWQIVSGTLPTGLSMLRNGSVPIAVLNNFITGTPVQAGKHTVDIRVYRYASYGGASWTQRFNIYVLGFTTQPAASTTINSGQTTTLSCVATGNPVGTTRHPGNGVLTYEWYLGTSGTLGPILGTSSSFTTPALTSSTNYWVRIKSVLGTNTVYANSKTAAVTVNPALSPFETWASLSGLPVDQRGATQIPMGDGVTNLEKFAFNLNPLAPDVRRLTAGASALAESAGLPVGSRVGGVLRIEFLRRKAGTNPGITYKPQFSSSLGGWVDFAGTESVSPAADSSWERVTVDDTTGGTVRFGRVKVEQTP